MGLVRLACVVTPTMVLELARAVTNSGGAEASGAQVWPPSVELSRPRSVVVSTFEPSGAQTSAHGSVERPPWDQFLPSAVTRCTPSNPITRKDEAVNG